MGADGATPSSLVSKGADIEPREVESSNRKEGHFAAPSRTCVPSSAASQFFATLPAFELLVTDGLNTVPIALELNSTFTGSSSASWFAGARWLAREETSLTAGVFQARADLGESGPYTGLDLGLDENDGTFGVVEIAWMPHSEKSTAAHEGRNFTRGRRELAGDGSGLPGIYKLGAYLSNEPEASYPGGWGGSPFGFHAIAQQMLWEQSPSGKLPSQFSIFGGVVWSPPRRIGGQSKTHDPCG